jgi:hypothetical protein
MFFSDTNTAPLIAQGGEKEAKKVGIVVGRREIEGSDFALLPHHLQPLPVQEVEDGVKRFRLRLRL